MIFFAKVYLFFIHLRRLIIKKETSMKNKIKEALKQEYKNLGLGDEAFDGVAAFGETVVKEEKDIEGFVKNAGPMLKPFQSSADRMRTENAELKKQIEELKAKQNPAGNEPPANPNPNPNQNQEPEPKQDIAALVAQAVKAEVSPLTEQLNAYKTKLEAYESKESIKALVSNAKAKFESNDYVKAYKDEATDAWERAIELNEASGNKLSEQELLDKAMGYFNKAVSKKGVDIEKPFESTGGNGDPKPNFAEMKARLQESGAMPKTEEGK